MTTQSLVAKYNKGIDLTTRGEFNLALDAFRACLQSVPISIVHSQAELKELQDLIMKCREYITAMRIEIERKRLVNSVSLEFLKCRAQRTTRG